MILSYSKEQFKSKIIAKIKIHSIREDKHDRWRPGMSIQHWLYSPRNVSKHPHQFGTSWVLGKQGIEIYWEENEDKKQAFVYIDGEPIDDQTMERLAINDGFENVDAFFEWFHENFYGSIIHWTDFKY